MPYMSDVIKLLETSFPHLIKLKRILDEEFSDQDNELEILLDEIYEMLKEYKALQIGHGGRVQ